MLPNITSYRVRKNYWDHSPIVEVSLGDYYDDPNPAEITLNSEGVIQNVRVKLYGSWLAVQGVDSWHRW